MMCGFLTLLLLVQLVPNATYHRETIDSIWRSRAMRVQVEGVVAVVTATQAGNITFRIGDEHGHFLGCSWPVGSKGEQPRIGARIRVFGVRHAFSVPERGQGVVEIDPVERIEPAE